MAIIKAGLILVSPAFFRCEDFRERLLYGEVQGLEVLVK